MIDPRWPLLNDDGDWPVVLDCPCVGCRLYREAHPEWAAEWERQQRVRREAEGHEPDAP